MVLVLDPFQAVAGDLPAGGLHRIDLLGRSGQRRCHAIDRDRHVVLGEEAMQPPETGPGAVFVDRFHVPVALPRPGRGTDDLREERFRRGVAMQDAVLAAFLVVQHELHGDPRVIGPVGRGRLGPVAPHISRVALHLSARSCCQLGTGDKKSERRPNATRNSGAWHVQRMARDVGMAAASLLEAVSKRRCCAGSPCLPMRLPSRP